MADGCAGCAAVPQLEKVYTDVMGCLQEMQAAFLWWGDFLVFFLQ